MTRRMGTWAVSVSALAALLGLAACTSGSGPSAPTSTAVRAPDTSAPPSTTTVSTAPIESTSPTESAAVCSPSSTRATYHRHLVALAGKKFLLGPGGLKHTTQRLDPLAVVHSQAPGLGTHSALIGRVDHHWGLRVAALGSQTHVGLPGVFSLGRAKKHDVRMEVLAYVSVFDGTFSSVCGGQRVAGHYRTFGVYGVVGAPCGDHSRGRAFRLARSMC